MVSAFVAGLQKLVDGFNSLPGPVQKAIAITGGIVLALTAIATAIGVVLAAFGMIMSGIGALATALGIAGGLCRSCWCGGWCVRKCIRRASWACWFNSDRSHWDWSCRI